MKRNQERKVKQWLNDSNLAPATGKYEISVNILLPKLLSCVDAQGAIAIVDAALGAVAQDGVGTVDFLELKNSTATSSAAQNNMHNMQWHNAKAASTWTCWFLWTLFSRGSKYKQKIVTQRVSVWWNLCQWGQWFQPLWLVLNASYFFLDKWIKFKPSTQSPFFRETQVWMEKPTNQCCTLWTILEIKMAP